MTIDPEGTTTGNDTSQNSSFYQKSRMSILFPNYRRGRSHLFLNDEPDDCPAESSSDGYGEVSCSLCVLYLGSTSLFPILSCNWGFA